MSQQTAITENHPLCSAKWIWPGSYLYLHNHFANFRKDFKLSSVPEKAPFFITADQAYRLYVNGKYICRGPARGYQSHWPFDEVDIAGQLNEGHNWIAVEAYNPGISTFGYVHETCAGFLCAAEWDDFKLCSDESWTMRRSPAHKSNTARYSLQLNFQEHVSGSEADRAWICSTEPPIGWNEAMPQAYNHATQFAFGRSPYFSVEPRGIPMLREEIKTPQKIVGSAKGKCAENWRDWENVTWEFAKEAKSCEWNDGSGVASTLSDGKMEMELQGAEKDSFSAIVIDMVEYAVGSLCVETCDGNEGAVLDFNYTEGREGLAPGFPEPEQNGSKVAMGNRLSLGTESVAHEFFNYIGFRYLTVVARGLTKALKIKLSVRTAEYPFEMRGNFKCSDETLNAIYAACRKTQQICSLDAYVDTPWREQAQWWGDARVQAKNTFYIDGDARLLKRGIRSIAGQTTPWGLTYGHAPTSAHNCILPDFSLTWILTLWDYYWQTGDLSLLKEQWPRVQEILAYFERHDILSPSGLLRHDRRLWYFGDWSNLYKGDVPAFLNLWNLLTLRKLTEMLKLAEMDKEAKAIEEKAKKQEQLIIEKLYDKQKGLIRDGLDENEKPVDSYSVHEQVLAVMLDIIPEASKGMTEKKLIPFIRQEEQDGAIPSPFWSTYPFEVLDLSGHGREVVDFIRNKWEPMLSTGTTWEHYTWNTIRAWSSSHAWTAHPSYHFVNILAGVKQTKANWESIEFSPCFPENIDFAEALVPSPRGDIKAGWKREEDGKITASISLPEKISAHIKLPGTDKIVQGGRSYEFSVKTD